MGNGNNLIRIAVATAIAAAAAQSASANDISTYSTSVVNVYSSGSTAVDNDLISVMAETNGPGGLCTSGSLDIYYEGTSGSFTNRMLFCTAGAGAGSLSGSSIAIFKESTAGSALGATPLYTYANTNTQSQISWIDANALKTAGCPVTSHGGGSHGIAAYSNHESCVTTAVTIGPVPNLGFADVEALILQDPTGAAVNTALVTKFLTTTGTVDQVWALALTKNVYYSLQAAEGYTSPSDLPANAPSLSHAEVSSLVSANLFNWSDIGVSIPADNNVYMCRRDPASGTEASFEYLFLNERCTQFKASQIPSGDGTFVWENGSSGKVRTCLQDVFVGGSFTDFLGNKATFTGNQGAFGFSNADITDANLTAASDSFRIVAIDGAGPTIANVQNGVYPYFSTGEAFTISSGHGALGSGTGNNNNDASVATMVGEILSKIGHPTFQGDSNANYTGLCPWNCPAGGSLTVGDMPTAPVWAASNPPTVVPATSASASTNPTNAFSKALSGSIINCDPAQWDSVHLEGTVTTSPESKLLGTTNINN
jgi:hypothetical protein